MSKFSVIDKHGTEFAFESIDDFEIETTGDLWLWANVLDGDEMEDNAFKVAVAVFPNGVWETIIDTTHHLIKVTPGIRIEGRTL